MNDTKSTGKAVLWEMKRKGSLRRHQFPHHISSGRMGAQRISPILDIVAKDLRIPLRIRQYMRQRLRPRLTG